MGRQIVIVIALLGVLGGCSRISESRLNPFNWFGRDRAVEVQAVETITDPRPLVSQVTNVSIERAPGGAILRAVGLPPRQGYWSPALIESGRGNGVVAFHFRLAEPPAPTRVSTQVSREVVVATYLTDQELAGVREIQVIGAQASRAVRR